MFITCLMKLLAVVLIHVTHTHTHIILSWPSGKFHPWQRPAQVKKNSAFHQIISFVIFIQVPFRIHERCPLQIPSMPLASSSTTASTNLGSARPLPSCRSRSIPDPQCSKPQQSQPHNHSPLLPTYHGRQGP